MIAEAMTCLSEYVAAAVNLVAVILGVDVERSPLPSFFDADRKDGAIVGERDGSAAVITSGFTKSFLENYWCTQMPFVVTPLKTIQ